METQISNLMLKSSFKQLKQIHGFLITTFLNKDLQTFSKFLRRTTEFGSMDYPQLVFSRIGSLFETEVMLWNMMIRGYAYNGPLEKSVSLFDEMRYRGLKVNNFTYPYVLSSCSEMGFSRKSLNLHSQIVKSGFVSNFAVSNSIFDVYVKMQACVDARKVFDEMSVKTVELCNRMISQYVRVGDILSARQLFDDMSERDVVSWNSMISGYTKVGEVAKARDLFDKLPEKNVVSWTTMICSYAHAGNVDLSRKIFEEMPFKNVVSWNAMISSYIKHERYHEALNLFMEMQSNGLVYDDYTLVSVLSACSYLGALDFGKWVHSIIRDWFKLGVIVRTALVDMYAKCGDIDTAFTLFIKIGVKHDVFCWNVMIKCMGMNGRTLEAVEFFYRMRKIGLEANDFTFSSVLFACSHGGLVEEGRDIFLSMERDFGTRPKIDHFCCLVDLLSRNGMLEEAKRLVMEMPYEPDIAIWGALLGGCRVRSDVVSAEMVMEKVLEAKANEPGVYALLSSIHASVGQWKRASSARETMDEKKIWKKAGLSSVV